MIPVDRETEVTYTFDLSTVSTADLQAELSRREGVRSIRLDYGVEAEITLKGTRSSDASATITGPAVITVNID